MNTLLGAVSDMPQMYAQLEPTILTLVQARIETRNVIDERSREHLNAHRCMSHTATELWHGIWNLTVA